MILNVEGFWDGFVGKVRRATEEGFMRGRYAHALLVREGVEEAVRALREYRTPESG